MAIALSAGVRNNLQSLQNTSNLIALSQNRLATGKKVNSAIDDPSAFFTAQNLSDRSAKLTKLLDGINSGVSTIKAASTGLDSIYKQLQSAQGIIDSLKADVAKASNQASGAATALTTSTALGAGAIGIANSDTITFTDSVSGGTTTVSLGATAATDTVQDLINKVNAQGNGVYSAALTNGKITFTSTGSNQFTVGVSNAGTANATATTALGGTSVVGTVDQTKINAYAKQFNDVLTSVDQFGADSSFNGVNLLRAGNNLDIVYNEDATSKSTVVSRDITASNFSLVNINATGSGTVANFTGQEAAIKNALASVRTYQSEYSAQLSTAQNRSDFAKNLSNLLLSGAESLTNADQNAEAANVLALQTRQQLSQSALSLSVQGDQAVLQLLR